MKNIFIPILIILAVFIAVRWDSRSTCPVPQSDAVVPSLMLEGKLYLLTDKQMPGEPDQSAVAGKVALSAEAGQWPTEDGQANFDAVGAPYAQTDDGYVLLVNDEWVLLEEKPVPPVYPFLGG